jgi:membrane protease YdiL (CAAX protease family)
MAQGKAAGLLVFFLVAFAVPWAGWSLLDDPTLNLWLFPAFASLAGFAAAYADGGPDGLRRFVRRTFRLRRTGGVVLVAVAIPLLLGALYMLAMGVGPAAFDPAFSSRLATGLAFAVFTGPLYEEFGWRGYLQPVLLARLRPIAVALALATIWCAWHYPLFHDSAFATLLSSAAFWGFCFAWSVFLVYLVPRAGGSVWPAVALHWAANTHASVLGALVPSVDGSLLPGGKQAVVLYVAAALVLVAVKRRYFFATPAPAPAPTAANTAQPLGETP